MGLVISEFRLQSRKRLVDAPPSRFDSHHGSPHAAVPAVSESFGNRRQRVSKSSPRQDLTSNVGVTPFLFNLYKASR